MEEIKLNLLLYALEAIEAAENVLGINFSNTNYAKEHSQQHTQEELKDTHAILAKACQSYLDTYSDCFKGEC
jgi:hypothetical protein